MIDTRKCIVCKKILPIENFSKAGKSWNGRMRRCKDCELIRDRERQNKRYEKRREYFVEYQREYYLKNPQKIKARLIVKRAIKLGIISKKPCAVCGDVDTTAHHPDYDKPMEIVWYCQKHHQREHSLIKTPSPKEDEKK